MKKYASSIATVLRETQITTQQLNTLCLQSTTFYDSSAIYPDTERVI